MAGITNGDMSIFFQNSKQTSAIKTRLETLTRELSTGQIDDIPAALKGDTRRLSGIDREIARIDGYKQVSDDLNRTLGQQQLNLNAINDMRVDLATEFLAVTSGATDMALGESAYSARASFQSIVSRLNTTVGDRALFAGNAVDGAALANAEDMLADMVASIGGATTPAAIGAILDTWFDDPAGGFATMGYLGDTGTATTRQIGEFETVEIEARADDPALREMLKGLATAAVVDVIGGGLSLISQRELIQSAAIQLNASGNSVIQLASRVGEVEARVQDIMTMNAAKRTSFSIARSEMTRADPFETAGRLQDVQTQLEIQFNLTARLSGLTLANYI